MSFFESLNRWELLLLHLWAAYELFGSTRMTRMTHHIPWPDGEKHLPPPTAFCPFPIYLAAEVPTIF